MTNVTQKNRTYPWILALLAMGAAIGLGMELTTLARFKPLALWTFACLTVWPAFGVAIIGGQALPVIRLLFALSVIGYMITTGALDVRMVGSAFAAWPWMLAGFILTGIPNALGAMRWQALLRVQGIHITFLQTLRLNLVGLFFSICIPGAVGGDIVRAYAISHRSDNTSQAVTTLLLERFLGLTALLSLCCLSAAINYSFLIEHGKIGKAVLFLTIAMCIGCAGLMVAMNRRLAAWARGTWMGKTMFPGRAALVNTLRALHAYHGSRGTLVYAWAVSIISHVTTILGAWAFAQAIGFHDIGIGAYFLLVPLGLTFNAIPISPGGIGQGQIAFGFLFSRVVAGGAAAGAAMMTLVHVAMFFVACIGGILYATGSSRLPHLEPEELELALPDESTLPDEENNQLKSESENKLTNILADGSAGVS